MTAYALDGRVDEGAALLERAADEIEAMLADGRVDSVRADRRRGSTDSEHLYVIGRGPSYPMALEAALKIKEVSYIHAEGFAGGELKHGVIALIEPGHAVPGAGAQRRDVSATSSPARWRSGRAAA